MEGRKFYELKDIKEYLRQQCGLRLHKNFNPKEKGFKNPYDLACYIFQNSPTSYYVKNGVEQCSLSGRSIYDIYRIVYYYFPKVKLITIYRAAFELLRQRILNSWVCTTTYKRMYSHVNSDGHFDACYTDELGCDFTKIPEFEKVVKSGYKNAGLTTLRQFPIKK